MYKNKDNITEHIGSTDTRQHREETTTQQRKGRKPNAAKEATGIAYNDAKEQMTPMFKEINSTQECQPETPSIREAVAGSTLHLIGTIGRRLLNRKEMDFDMDAKAGI